MPTTELISSKVTGAPLKTGQQRTADVVLKSSGRSVRRSGYAGSAASRPRLVSKSGEQPMRKSPRICRFALGVGRGSTETGSTWKTSGFLAHWV